MTRSEIGAYRTSESLVFGGQVHKTLDVDKNLNYHCHWVKNITLECCRFCPTNGVHLKELSEIFRNFLGCHQEFLLDNMK